MMNMSSDQKDESVEDLLKKLAKKGKKVKLLDETASVKELPKQEDADGIEEELDLNRREGEEEERMNDSVDEIDEE